MPFQFLCPQGHLLQGDESQMGMQTQCPLCGLVFIIPQVAPQAAPQYPQPQQQYPQQQYPQQPAGGYQAPAPQAPAHFAPQEAYQSPAPQYPSFHEPDAPHAAEPAASAPNLGDDLPDVESPEDDLPLAFLHIPCPNGHELETPVEMLGEEVLCPHCGAQFLLREEDSVEHQEHLDALDIQRAHAWFNWAIAATVIVVISLLAMVVVAMRG
jgi:rubredoxin